MKASVTSILAYHDLDLGSKQLEVLRTIQLLNTARVPASCEAICGALGYTPNRVTGRIKELMNKGAIDYDSFTKSKFNKDVQTYKLVEKGQGALC